ncbi:MAG: zinc dependent phospholipase C family protein [Deltaproteobacteria bacterium]|nr:zinc dependent phospholipase C family protein [Deltaproteobacteria bacterium]
MGIFLITLIGFLLAPTSAFAWGPITHLNYGIEVLSNLSMLVGPLQELLKSYPHDFLYGCLAADITLKKNLVAYIHHCHNWDVGLSLLQKAKDPHQRAFVFGYLTHLAADTISHNYYVPFFTVSSFSTTTLKHTYWELRFDATREDKFWNMTKDVTQKYHKSDHDDMLKIHLKRTLLPFATNKLIFNGLMTLSESKPWHHWIRRFSQNSPWELSNEDVQEFFTLAMQAIFDFLNHQKDSKVYLIDPSGKIALDQAKTLRKEFKLLSKALPEEEIQKRLQTFRNQLKQSLFEKPAHQKWVKVQ